MAYDSPEFLIDREYSAAAAAGATTEYAKFRAFAASTLEKVAAVVVTAGTNTGHGYDVYVGTASVGTIALGTKTAGQSVTATVNAAVPALGQFSVKSLADATGAADIVYTFSRKPDY